MMILKQIHLIQSIRDDYILSTLQWNCHISDVIKKANKRMFFPVLLKRAKVPPLDIISFDHTCIRPVLVAAHPYTTMHRLRV